MSGSRWALGLALGLGLGLAAGCTPELCGRTSDCPSGLVCTSIGTCLVPADASVDDGPPDDEVTVTPIYDADGDAFDIEPIDAGIDADIDADLIDAPDDDGLTAGAPFDGAW